MSQHLFKKTLLVPISVCCWPRLLVKIAPNRSCFTFGRPLPARNTSKVASGEGGPEVSKCMPEFTFGANLGVLLAPTFGENGSKSKLLHFLGSRWRPYVARIPSHWPLGVFLGASFSFAQKFNCLSNSRCYAGQVYAQAVLKVAAPGDVSSVGGTPGVWCLNVIGRECWVWVVPCTGSWPGQPPPTKWGKEP